MMMAAIARMVCRSEDDKFCAATFDLLLSASRSFRDLSGRLKFTVRRHKFNKDSPSLFSFWFKVQGLGLRVSGLIFRV